MIYRQWRGLAKPDGSQAYLDHLRKEAFPAIGKLAGASSVPRYFCARCPKVSSTWLSRSGQAWKRSGDSLVMTSSALLSRRPFAR
jgi:hypothetical protein